MITMARFDLAASTSVWYDKELAHLTVSSHVMRSAIFHGWHSHPPAISLVSSSFPQLP